MARGQDLRAVLGKTFSVAAIAAAAWIPSAQALPIQGGPDGHYYEVISGSFGI